MGEQSNVSVTIPYEQALVLFDWLVRTSEAEQPAPFEDQAEQRAMWDLGATLEALLPAVLGSDYRAELLAARSRSPDSDGQ